MTLLATRYGPLVWARVVVDVLVTRSSWVGGAGLAVGLLVLVTGVIGRAFSHPISGSSEIKQMCFVVIVFRAVPMCERTAGNVRLDLFEPWEPIVLDRVFDGIAMAMGLVSIDGICTGIFSPIDSSTMGAALSILLRYLVFGREGTMRSCRFRTPNLTPARFVDPF